MKSSHKRLLSLCLSLALLLVLFPIFNAIAADAASGTCTSGHSYETVVTAPTCTEDGITTSTCTVCGDVLIGTIPAIGHSYEIVTNAPTCVEDGSTTSTCTTCGDVLIGTIPATGHQFEGGICIHCSKPKPIASGECGKYATWTLDTNGTLTISGTGFMADYEFDVWGEILPWGPYRSQIKSVDIQQGITHISAYGFVLCENLTNVTIPESVKSIGWNAFNYCTGLTTINIPEGVTSIGGYTFSDCTSLTDLTIPESVTSIGDNAFYQCTGLTDLTIHKGVASIGSSAFSRCTV